MDKKKASNLLGAGTISGFILALFLLLSNGDVQSASVASESINTNAGIVEVVPMENYNQLQEQNDQLVQDLETMQSREQQYAQQISAANNVTAQQNNTIHPEERDEHEEHDEREERREHEENEHDDHD